MDAAAPTAPANNYNAWLPYWAVFQADFSQTFHSWIYRFWVGVSCVAASGYLLYRFGARRESGMIQPAPEALSELLHWVVYGTVTLIIVLSAGAICAERGTVADSVLSRGISRYQYFLGKWHARLALILLTFVTKAMIALTGAYFLLHSDALSVQGSAVAILTVSLLLVAVTTCGVSISALTTNTILSIAVVWSILYGAAFTLSLLPGSLPSPEQVLASLPNMLKGFYDWSTVLRLTLLCGVGSIAFALGGMILFARGDV